MKARVRYICAVACMVVALTLGAPISDAFASPIANYSRPHPEIRNIVVMIPDGMSTGGLTLSRWYKSYDRETGEFGTNVSLALDEMASGLVRTYWRSSDVLGAITDSAPAGTAFATGNKTNDKHIAVTGDKVQSPYATILEAAETMGKSTGLVATSNIQHATPAAFSSHYFDRSRYDILGEQQVYQGIDVVLGGGFDYLTAPYRKDGENMIDELKNLGYEYVTTKGQLSGVTGGKVWGMFAGDAMAYEMDRELTAKDEPSLSEMTRKAIDILSKNENGFFLMVEGSKVDWAAHANDPMGIISDVLAFDDAVAVALAYAKEHQDTMILAMTDHGNGGISIGDIATTNSYSKDPVARFVAPLGKAVLTGEGVEKMLDKDRGNIKQVMERYYGISDLTDAEVLAIKESEAGAMNYTVGPMLSARANIGWTSGGHTGEDVMLFSYLPGGNRLSGTIDNTDIAKVSAAGWGTDLGKLTSQLYMNANETFKAKGAAVTVDRGDPENMKLVVKAGDKTLSIPESKNFVLLDGGKVETGHVTVQTNGVFYVSQAVIDLMK